MQVDYQATIHDVANKAKVSPATVSRSFSRPDLVAANTRNRVLEIAKSMDFSIAKSSGRLRSGKSNKVALLFPGSSATWFHSQIIEGLNSVLHEQGYDLSLCRIHNVHDQELYFKELPTRKNVDAVVVPSFNVGEEGTKRLRRLNVPIAGINIQSKSGLTIGTFINDCNIMKKIAKHLISLGHRNIVYIGFTPSSTLQFSAGTRLTGFLDACAESPYHIKKTLVSLDEENVTEDMLHTDSVVSTILNLPEKPPQFVVSKME